MKPAGEATAYSLGIEGGGTKTVTLSSTGERRQFGPLNLKLSTDAQILAILRQFKPRQAAVCLAGCRTDADRQRIGQLARKAWPHAESVFFGNDLDSGLAAAFGRENPGIYVLSGTGSVVVGRNPQGEVARAGGWGHLLGDHGSGYWIASTGLRAAIREYDRHGRVNERLASILRRLCLNSPEQLVDWIHQATKDEIAALTAEVLDDDAGLMLQAASFLAQDCHAVALKLGLTQPAVALAGGVLQHHRKLAILVSNRIRTMLPGATVKVLRRDTVEGALLLAGSVRGTSLPRPVAPGKALPQTEHRNPRTMDLDRRSIPQLIDTMLNEEARVIPAIRRNKHAIERCLNTIVASFKRGGRLFYVGAGTSGRIGVLDASECPPTFSTASDMVQGIIAGGAPALHSPIEAGEDNRHAGADAIANRGVGKRDVVVGIAASGRTPFVLAALDEAKARGAKTFLLCFSSPIRPLVHSPILIDTGPEVITGSTRLKAGTATKLVLNMLTTISMIRLGKVVSNLMVDVKPTNDKLRARASRIVAALRGCTEDEARQRLVRAGWNVQRALAG
jgi:N-acetylmuramic acid 6-phosphate etherase